MKWLLVVFFLFNFKTSLAAKKKVLSPFQQNIQQCLGESLELGTAVSSLKIYKLIQKNFSLITSETLYREVEYTKKNERLKLKYENELIQIYKINDEDDSLTLESSEKLGEQVEDYKMRHQIRDIESKFAQLLFQANIKSDYQKQKETRSQGLALDIEWSNGQIKSLQIQSELRSKKLKCSQKGQLDICSCH